MFGASSELAPNMFGASSQLVRSWFEAEPEIWPIIQLASSELASVMEFGFYSLSNVSAKNYQNQFVHVKVIARQISDIFRHSVAFCTAVKLFHVQQTRLASP